MEDNPPRNHLDIAIVGLGPAGIAAASRLSKAGEDLDIACFEMGPRPEHQACPVLHNSSCLERTGCHILTGFGGASLLSGGKLSTLPAGDSLIDITEDSERVERALSASLEWFNSYLEIQEPSIGRDEISDARKRFEGSGFELDYYDSHLMTGDKESIKDGFSKMCADLEQGPASFHFNSTVKDIGKVEKGYQFDVETSDNRRTFTSENVILGVGIPGKGLLNNLKQEFGVDAMNGKLEFGIRLEFPTDLFPEIDQGHNDLKLHRGNCRTFCVCKGGKLAPYYHDGASLLDGHVNRSDLTNLTNLGIRLRLPPSMENDSVYNEILESYLDSTEGVPIRQSYPSYIANEPAEINNPTQASMTYWVPGDVNKLFPEPFGSQLRDNVEKFIKGVIPSHEVSKVSVYAPGLYYPGLEFDIDRDFSVGEGLYIIGEGTGKFRGILQAFSSGLLCAESLTER